MLGLNAVRLFEIGTVFRNDTESVRIAVGILGLKAKKELDSLTKEMEREFKINLKSDGTGGIGMETNLGSSNFEIFTFPLGLVVKNNSIPSSYENLPLSSATRYQPFSRQPFIIRDVAFWCPKDTDADAIEKNIRELAGSLCVNVFLFDRFEKGDRVSLAYRLIFQSPNRTLIEDEINPLMDGVYAALKRGFEIR